MSFKLFLSFLSQWQWFPSFPVLPTLPVGSLPLLCSCSPSLLALGNVFLASRPQPEHHFLRGAFLDHLPSPPTSPSHPYFSESCHRSHSTSCLFSGYPFQRQFYICSCHYSKRASVSSSDCRPCEGRKYLFLLTIVCPCLVQDLAVVDSVYICGIVRYMGPVADWMAGFPLLLSCYRLNPDG